MTEELYLIHIVFIASCVYFSYKSGRNTAKREYEEFIISETIKNIRK
jgi:hypothetical protein